MEASLLPRLSSLSQSLEALTQRLDVAKRGVDAAVSTPLARRAPYSIKQQSLSEGGVTVSPFPLPRRQVAVLAAAVLAAAARPACSPPSTYSAWNERCRRTRAACARCSAETS